MKGLYLCDAIKISTANLFGSATFEATRQPK